MIHEKACERENRVRAGLTKSSPNLPIFQLSAIPLFLRAVMGSGLAVP
jgi:hypothetical protein